MADDAELSRAAAAGQLSPGERLRQQVEFAAAIDRLKAVERNSTLTDGSRAENSAEHSWHIAVIAMLLREHAAPDIDPLHVLELLLVHDIVEIDAGDTDCYDEAGYSDRELRERAAAKRLFGMLPDDQASHFIALWEEFEAGQTPAAVLANAIDRFQPLIIARARDGDDWRPRARSRAQLLARLAPIRTAIPVVWTWVLDIVDEVFPDAPDESPT